MNKISREALLEMEREAGCYRDECGFAECDFDAMERFAELVLAAQQQKQQSLAVPNNTVVIPAGYVLVPIEPTYDMCEAAAIGDGSELVGEFLCIGRFDIAYKDALAVAPQPPIASAEELIAAELEACAELISSQHTWLTNVAAARLILSRIKK